MSKRDISAGIRARQRATRGALHAAGPMTGDLPAGGEPAQYATITVPAHLADRIEEHVLRINRAARDAGRAGLSKRRFVELALDDLLRAQPAEILARDERRS